MNKYLFDMTGIMGNMYDVIIMVVNLALTQWLQKILDRQTREKTNIEPTEKVNT